MAISALVRGHSEVTLWGLESATRLNRQLASLNIAASSNAADSDAGPSDTLIVSAEYLFELRTLKGVMQHRNKLLICPQNSRIAAVLVSNDEVERYLPMFEQALDNVATEIERMTPVDLASFDGDLRRVEPPVLEALAVEKQTALESLLYGNAYKGITDLVTKWWWPKPARAIVAWCAKRGITPNQVTGLGLLLVALSSVLFAHGYFLSGLLSGWIMTLLDTVDGKLARVTVQSSRVGHILDHGTDIIHPPFWYVFWAQGLGLSGTLGGLSYDQLVIAIVAGYVGGRIFEGAFELFAKCSMFAWRPFDAYFRLVTARRNPCLIILSVFTICGRPDLGLLGVVAWTVLSTLILLVRVVYAAMLRLGGDPLTSWLAEPRQARERYPRAYQTFSGTRRAYD